MPLRRQAGRQVETEVVVLGGGPAGCALAGQLAAWGHDVLLLTTRPDPRRVLANSLPPSTRKLLAQVNFLDIVERVGFPTFGNRVWWGAAGHRVERFDGRGDACGYQVVRPSLDVHLVERAESMGVRILRDAVATSAVCDRSGARIECRQGSDSVVVEARLAVDCSGRAGVIARGGWRRHPPDVQMQALIGVWNQAAGWDLVEAGYTSVETYEDGWAWSVPVSSSECHVGVMVHSARSRLARGSTLEATYTAELAKSKQLFSRCAGAALAHVWACDASIYSSHDYAGPGFQLAGDAASTIDPLSSFGVKKALASAWIGAIVAHTRLLDPDREALACHFCSRWERRVYATSLQQGRDFARDAFERHPSPFWEGRLRIDTTPDAGEAGAGGHDDDDDTLLKDAAVARALAALKEREAVRFRRNPSVEYRQIGLIREHEIVPAAAIAIGPNVALSHLGHVDLIALAAIAPACAGVPDLFDGYCRKVGAVSLGAFLGALSFLVARGVLELEPPS